MYSNDKNIYIYVRKHFHFYWLIDFFMDFLSMLCLFLGDFFKEYPDIILLNSRVQILLFLLDQRSTLRPDNKSAIWTLKWCPEPRPTLRLYLPPCAAPCRALKEAFLHQLLRGSRQYDLQLRNDLLVITTLIAQIPKSPLIVRRGSLLSCHTWTPVYLLKAQCVRLGPSQLVGGRFSE